MIRQLDASEIKMASDLADNAHRSELYESLECFEKKFSFFPRGFLGYFCGDRLIGYAIGHPWKGNGIVPLDYLEEFPENPDCFYLHDIVVDKDFRNRGYAKSLTKEIIDVGKSAGFGRFLLVAVNETARKICEEHGFELEEEILYGNGVKSWKMSMEMRK